MSEGPPLEVIGQGREPVDARPPRGPLPRGLRITGTVLLAAVGIGAVYLTARPHQVTDRAKVPAAAAVPSTLVIEPTQSAIATLPLQHELVASTAAGDHTFIAFGGHVLLFLRVTYTGTAPVRIVDGRVPQAGAYPDAGAGGLTAGTSANVALRKGVPTELFVRTRVNCDLVTAGDAVDHLDVITQPDGGPPRGEVIEIDGLGPFWDEARQAACKHPDASRDVAMTVTDLQATPSVDGHYPWVQGVLTLHDVAGFDAVVTLQDPSWSVLSRTVATMTSAGAVVQGGSTYTTPVRWTITDCAVAATEPPPALATHVVINESEATLAGDLGPSFATAWRLALLAACR